MVTLTNIQRPGGMLQSEANFSRSLEKIVVEGGTGGAGTCLAGTVMGKVTATGRYMPSPATGTDGSQIACAVLWEAIETGYDFAIEISAIVRDAEVRASDLNYDASVSSADLQQVKWAQLASVGIIVRV